MHSHAFDRYHHKHSFVHNLDPRVKVAATVAFILSNALLPDGAWVAFLAAYVFMLAANVGSGLGLGFTFRRSFIALPFALAAVTVLFSIAGAPVASFQLLRWNIVVTDAGLARFMSIVVRSWLSVQMAILLVATTEFPKIVHALRQLRVPAILTVIILFLYRYLFVLADEAMRLMRARASRSAITSSGKGGGSALWRARVAGNMAGQLFLRSYERSDRVYNAMLSRGYTGELRIMQARQFRANDWLMICILLLCLAFIQIVGRML